MRWHRGLALTILTVCLTACSEQDFGSFGLLDRLRILGARSAEHTIPQGDTELEVFTYSPGGDEPSVSWRWCPYKVTPNDNYACPVTRDEFIELLGLAARDFEDELGFLIDPEIWERTPAFELGGSQVFRNPWSADEALLVCYMGTLALLNHRKDLQQTQFPPDVDCEVGYRVDLVANIEDGDASLATRKSLILQTNAFVKLRHPVIEKVQVRELGGLELGPEQGWVELGAERFVLARGSTYQVRAVIDPESVDPLFFSVTEDEDGGDEDSEPEDVLDEELRDELFAGDWFSTRALPMGSSFGGVYFSPNDDDEAPETLSVSTFIDLSEPEVDPEFGAPPEDPCGDSVSSCDVDVMVVVRDEQFGIAWTSIPFRVE